MPINSRRPRLASKLASLVVKMVAVCEQCGPADGAQCSVFFMRTRKRVKTVIYPSASKSNFTSCCFTGDSQSLVTIAGPEMVVWDWMSQKVRHTIALGGEAQRDSKNEPVVTTCISL